MSWLEHVKRDPVPWLLDPVNPCVRTLTLRHIFNRSEEQVLEEQSIILTWEPVRKVLAQFTRMNLWGRASNPYYGGPMGTFGTLYVLTQLGVPNSPEIDQACQNLLQQGRRSDGRFAPSGETAVPWFCYAGIALQILWHFGYGGTLSARSSWTRLVEAVLNEPEWLACSSIAEEGCRWSLVKALSGLLSAPAAQYTDEDKHAIAKLAESLLNQTYDFEGRDASWLRPVFPRYYETDLLELCYVLAQTSYKTNPRYLEFLRRLVALQTERGAWLKYGTHPVFMEERINQPSRWLTFQAVHTLIRTYGGNAYAA
jgi:hypothetical protein